jgi:hypothetical protein
MDDNKEKYIKFFKYLKNYYDELLTVDDIYELSLESESDLKVSCYEFFRTIDSDDIINCACKMIKHIKRIDKKSFIYAKAYGFLIQYMIILHHQNSIKYLECFKNKVDTKIYETNIKLIEEILFDFGDTFYDLIEYNDTLLKYIVLQTITYPLIEIMVVSISHKYYVMKLLSIHNIDKFIDETEDDIDEYKDIKSENDIFDINSFSIKQLTKSKKFLINIFS